MTTTTAPNDAATPEVPGRTPAGGPVQYTRLRQIVAGRYNGPVDTDDMLRRANALANSRTAVPYQVRGNAADILMYFEWAQALDIPIAVAFREVYFGDRGVAGIHAAFMHALLIRAGHRIEQLHLDGRKCVLRIRYADGTASPQVTWHILEAQRAGLFGKKDSPWRNYSEDMLWARAVSRLCRRHAPDATQGLHTPEELAEGVDQTDVLAPAAPELDAEGNPIVAPDVAAFLDGAEQLTADELLAKLKEADDSGLLLLFAGTDDNGLHMSVQEVLFDLGQAARAREAAAGTLTGGGIDPDESRHLDDRHQADQQDAAEAESCCPPEYLLENGNHLPNCANYIPEREA